jgi:hypothetical protein
MTLSMRAISERILLKVRPQDTVMSLKRRLLQESGWTSNPRLVFEGQLLSDDHRLQDYGLVDGNTVDVILKRRADYAPEAPVEDSGLERWGY